MGWFGDFVSGLLAVKHCDERERDLEQRAMRANAVKAIKDHAEFCRMSKAEQKQWVRDHGEVPKDW